MQLMRGNTKRDKWHPDQDYDGTRSSEGKVGRLMNKLLNFGDDLDQYPYHDTGKTCLGEGMHCPSTSSYTLFQKRKPKNSRQ